MVASPVPEVCSNSGEGPPDPHSRDAPMYLQNAPRRRRTTSAFPLRHAGETARRESERNRCTAVRAKPAEGRVLLPARSGGAQGATPRARLLRSRTRMRRTTLYEVPLLGLGRLGRGVFGFVGEAGRMALFLGERAHVRVSPPLPAARDRRADRVHRRALAERRRPVGDLHRPRPRAAGLQRPRALWQREPRGLARRAEPHARAVSRADGPHGDGARRLGDDGDDRQHGRHRAARRAQVARDRRSAVPGSCHASWRQ